MLRSLKVGIVGLVLLIIWIIFGFIAFNPILEYGIKDQTALKKNSERRDIYLKLPFALDYKIYFFNVSNPMEVHNGSKPILKEIGPYCYDEYKEKIDVTDNEAEDSLTYSPYDIYKFNEEKSGKLSEEDYVTIINPVIVGMVNHVARESPALLSIVNQAISSIFRNPQSIYLTGKVKDILFDGIDIDCNVSEFAAKATCAQMKNQIPGLKETNEKNIFSFSLLGLRNATVGKSIKVGRGIVNSRDLGRVIEVDGKKELNLWASRECNTFKGTDGWIIPPLLTPEEGVWTFSSDLCRNIDAIFIRDGVLKGVKVRRYEATLGDMNEESQKCYCPTPTTCLKRGVMDLSKCMGVPIYATLPHFLEADETYLQQVQGLHPSHEDHILKFELEPLTGTPIEARKRMQLNLPIAPNPKIKIMRTLPEALHPIFWLEEGVDLDGPILKKITNIFFVLKLFRVFRWIGIILCSVLSAYGFYVYSKNRKSVKITPMHDSTERATHLTRSTNVLLDSMNNINLDKQGTVNPVLTGREFDKYNK